MAHEGLAGIVNRQPDLEVCGEASSPAEAMSALSKKTDLMVTDMKMPGHSGIQFLKDVHAMLPDLPILVLSMHHEMLYAERALRVGARLPDEGCWLRQGDRSHPPRSDRPNIRQPPMSVRLLDTVTGRRPRRSNSPIEKLSDREFEVFRLLGSGKSIKEVADALHLDPKTVDVHRTPALRRACHPAASHVNSGMFFGDEPWLDPRWHQLVRQHIERARTLRDQIVAIAEREYDEWHDPNLTETSPAGRLLVQKYWQTGVRRTVSDANLASPAWQDANPWSAAFISYVMREAGAGPDFRYAAAHAVYIRQTIDDRLNGANTLFRAYRPNERPLEPGDLIGRARENSGATYDTVRPGMFTHCDIITTVNPAGLNTTAIGGNVHNNVDRKINLGMDGAGYLTAPGYFVVIKIVPTIPRLPSAPCPIHPGRSHDGITSRAWRRPGVVRCLPGAFRSDFDPTAAPSDFETCTCDPMSRALW